MTSFKVVLCAFALVVLCEHLSSAALPPCYLDGCKSTCSTGCANGTICRTTIEWTCLKSNLLPDRFFNCVCASPEVGTKKLIDPSC